MEKPFVVARGEMAMVGRCGVYPKGWFCAVMDSCDQIKFVNYETRNEGSLPVKHMSLKYEVPASKMQCVCCS